MGIIEVLDHDTKLVHEGLFLPGHVEGDISNSHNMILVVWFIQNQLQSRTASAESGNAQTQYPSFTFGHDFLQVSVCIGTHLHRSLLSGLEWRF